MKNILKIALLFLLVIQSSMLFSQENKIELKKGNEYFEVGKFNLAKISYEKILETNPDYYPALFNLGCAEYRISETAKDSLRGNYIENSIDYFENSKEVSKINIEKSNAFYNLGNSLLNIKRLKESIEAYKNALRNNPLDEEARYNLSYAMKKLIAQESSVEDLQKKIDDLQKKINELDNKKQNQKDEEQKKSEKEKKELQK
jgi:tetratricopeptide (TPR) repeat protein